MMLSRRRVEQAEEQLREKVRALPEPQRRAFYQRFDQAVKDPDSYAVLNYLFITGLHHFYLGKWLRGSFNLTLFLVAVSCLLAGQFKEAMIIFIAVTLWEMSALFRSQLIVQHHNNQTMHRILQQLDTGPP